VSVPSINQLISFFFFVSHLLLCLFRKKKKSQKEDDVELNAKPENTPLVASPTPVVAAAPAPTPAPASTKDYRVSTLSGVNDIAVFSVSVLRGVELRELLGAGQFGEVYRGTWNDTDVAAKKLKDQRGFDEFVKETNFMFKLKHPNLVQVRPFSLAQFFFFD
jgi:hypothetical protein